jgi:hypothetical protein
MYSEHVTPHAPPGKVRLIGTEHGQDFLVGDYDRDTPQRELDDIIHMNRGAGIEIRTVTEEDDSTHDER